MEIERTRAFLQEWKHSSGLRSIEERWQKEISQLKELLKEKKKMSAGLMRDKLVAPAEWRAVCSKTEGTETESHEKELSEREETYRGELSERVERFKKELSEKEESFSKELSDTQIKSRKEITKLCESWDKGAQQWNVEKRELEENVIVKENIWNYKASERKEEMQHFTAQCIQLHVRWLSFSFRFQQLISQDFRLLEVKSKCAVFLFSAQTGRKKQKKSFWSWSHKKTFLLNAVL